MQSIHPQHSFRRTYAKCSQPKANRLGQNLLGHPDPLFNVSCKIPAHVIYSLVVLNVEMGLEFYVVIVTEIQYN